MTETTKREKKIQVYYVEDHEMLRRMARQYISIQGDIELCGTSSTGEEAMEDPRLTVADIALIDLSLPGMSGFELLERIRTKHPLIICLVLSGQHESYYAQQALDSGAMGYILKGKPVDITKAIRAVVAGDTFVSAQMLRG